MAGKVLGIEIGSKITRVVEMEPKKDGAKIHNYFAFETPDGVNDDGNLTVNDNFMMLLRENIRRNEIKADRAIFSLNTSRIAVREVLVPMVKKAQLRDMVIANAAEYFPVDLKQYELGIDILGEEVVEGNKQYRLSLSAIPKDLLEVCKEIATVAELSLAGVNYAGNAMAESALKEYSEGLSAYIKIDEDFTSVVICEDDQIKLQRTIKYGLGEAIEIIQHSGIYGRDLSYIEAAEYMRQKNCIRRYLNPDEGYTEREDSDAEVAQLRQDVTGALAPLLSNIERILNYYLGKNENVAFDGLYLMGLGATASGLSDLMHNEFGSAVFPISDVSGIIYAKSYMQDEFHAVEYISCIRGALNPAFGTTAEKQAKKEIATAKEKDGGSLLVPGLVCTVLVIAAVVMVALPLVQRLSMSQEKKDLEREIAARSAIKLEYEAGEQAKLELASLEEMVKATETQNDNLVAFIQELEAKMPSEIITLSLTADNECVVMEIGVRSKEAAAKVMVQLRSFESVEIEPSTSLLEEEIDDSGSHLVAFKVACSYPGVDIIWE